MNGDRIRKRGMQREDIVAAAARMFVEQGIKAVRMDDIARQIGVSKRTLYEQFEDKEELIYQSVSYFAAEQDRTYAELAAGAQNVLDAMLRVFSEMMNFTEINHRMQTNLQRFYPKVYERIAAEHRCRDGFGKFRLALLKGVEEGFFQPDVDFDLAIEMLRYSVEGLVVRRDVLRLCDKTTHEALVFLIVNFLRGISTPKGMRFIDEFIEQQRNKH